MIYIIKIQYNITNTTNVCKQSLTSKRLPV